ncbi:MAG: hypothetical protein EOM25_02800 [Deltaproteobacteria bacterium]|nr:hypothetical protein [Deltaproteobacteria bacterium]
MNFQIYSFLLGLFAAFLTRNVWDYRVNTTRPNHDRMGAEINWHVGFGVAWIPVILAASLHDQAPWWTAITVLALTPVASFAALLLLRFLLTISRRILHR